MISCAQCGKPAVVKLKHRATNNYEIPLCIDCNLKFQQAMELQYNRFASMLNFLTGEIEATTGLYGIHPRFEVTQPLVHQGPMTFHNIKVDRSVVGAINTGEVEKIDVAMSHISACGSEELARLLGEFTEAVIAEQNINAEVRNQIIEQIAFLATQSVLPRKNRKPSIIRAVLTSLKDAVATIASLSSLWDKLQPLLERAFG